MKNYLLFFNNIHKFKDPDSPIEKLDSTENVTSPSRQRQPQALSRPYWSNTALGRWWNNKLTDAKYYWNLFWNSSNTAPLRWVYEDASKLANELQYMIPLWGDARIGAEIADTGLHLILNGQYLDGAINLAGGMASPFLLALLPDLINPLILLYFGKGILAGPKYKFKSSLVAYKDPTRRGRPGALSFLDEAARDLFDEGIRSGEIPHSEFIKLERVQKPISARALRAEKIDDALTNIIGRQNLDEFIAKASNNEIYLNQYDSELLGRFVTGVPRLPKVTSKNTGIKLVYPDKTTKNITFGADYDKFIQDVLFKGEDIGIATNRHFPGAFHYEGTPWWLVEKWQREANKVKLPEEQKTLIKRNKSEVPRKYLLHLTDDENKSLANLWWRSGLEESKMDEFLTKQIRALRSEYPNEESLRLAKEWIHNAEKLGKMNTILTEFDELNKRNLIQMQENRSLWLLNKDLDKNRLKFSDMFGYGKN